MRIPILRLRPVSRFAPKAPSLLQFHASSSNAADTSFHDLSTSNEVLTILGTINPMEPALEPLVPFLSRSIVSAVIEGEQNRRLGFRFFIWATKRQRFYSRLTVSFVMDTIVKENGVDLYWKTIEEIKDSGFEISSDAFTLLMLVYAKMGLCEKAIEVFGKMREFNCVPNVYAYNTILHVILRKKVFILALGIHSQMLKLNCQPNVVTLNILMDGYCKCGQTQHALQMYDEMEVRGIAPSKITYTIVISGLCQAKRVDEALKLFSTMKESGCLPDYITYNTLLDGFCKLARVDEALKLFSMMKENGCLPDYITYNTLLDGFCKLARVDEALDLLRSFQEGGFELGLNGYSCLIDGLFRARRFNEALAWYGKMIEKNVKPDVILYTILMRGLSEAGRVKDALKLLTDMNERGVQPDTYCYNALIKGFCDMGLLNEARSIQLEISNNSCFPNACTYTILICSMCRNGLVGEAKEIFDEMEKIGCSPSVVTFNALIDGLCKAYEMDKARRLFHEMQIGRNPAIFLRFFQGAYPGLDNASLQSVVETLCDSGHFLKAYKILNKHAESVLVPDVRTYNILINGFVRVGDMNIAWKLFNQMPSKGLLRDSVTYGTVINGFQMLNREDVALQLFNQMEEQGCTRSRAVFNLRMTWLCRMQKLPQAINLWLEHLRQRPDRDDKVVKEIKENFERGELEKAVRDLLAMDFKLNDFCLAPYTIWLIGFCQAGKVEEAFKLFSILKGYNVTVTAPSCVKLIQSFCKEGNLDLAVDVFLYTLEKGFMLNRRIYNKLLKSLLLSEDKKNGAFYLLCRMESLGYNLRSYISQSTNSLLRRCWDSCEMENVPPG